MSLARRESESKNERNFWKKKKNERVGIEKKFTYIFGFGIDGLWHRG